jgi:hypothetical protein
VRKKAVLQLGMFISWRANRVYGAGKGFARVPDIAGTASASSGDCPVVLLRFIPCGRHPTSREGLVTSRSLAPFD